VDTVFEGHGIVTAGVPWIYYQDAKPSAKYLGPWWQYRPAEAKKLLAEAGHPNGFETTLFYYEDFPQMSSQVQLVQQDLYLHSKSTKNFFRVNDPVIDELTVKLRQTPDPAGQRAMAKKIVEREYDQVLRMWPRGRGRLYFRAWTSSPRPASPSSSSPTRSTPCTRSASSRGSSRRPRSSAPF
jgi:ABC-type transport system substrate-binding protein